MAEEIAPGLVTMRTWGEATAVGIKLGPDDKIDYEFPSLAPVLMMT